MARRSFRRAKPQRGAFRLSNVILLVVSCTFALMLGEGLFRLILFSDAFPGLAQGLTKFIGDIYAGDVGYRLQHRLELRGREDEPLFPEFHPLLGWTARPIRDDNPLGITTNAPYSLDTLRYKKTVLFFGDSFTYGLTDLEYKIPQLLDLKLVDLSVLNLGVAGYGLDQMYLYLKTVRDSLDEVHVMIGLFYNDIDRCVYKIREAPKPYFEVEAGELILKGTPLPAHYGKWLEVYPLPGRSYLLSAGVGSIRRQFKRRWASENFFQFHPSETQRKREEKEALTRFLLEKIKEETDRKGWELTFVVFPYRIHLIKQGWYEAFLRKQFAELSIDYVDMKEPLLRHMKENRLQWHQLYLNNNHPTVEENQLMVDFLADYVKQQYGYEIRR